jgi:hypothetical protein
VDVTTTSRFSGAAAVYLAALIHTTAITPAQEATRAAAEAHTQATQTLAQVTQKQLEPSRAPLFNRANERLPSWLRVRGEFRERMEGFDNSGFTESRDDLYWLSRFRFDTTFTPSKMFSFQAQVQDARVGKKTVGTTGTPFTATFDLRQAVAQVGSSTSPFAVRVGRQELVYGEQRLVGHVSWLNAARTFDGAKLTMRGKAFSADVFAASLVRILEDEFDKSGNGNLFAGIHGTTTRLVPKGTFEPYVFYRHDINQTGEAGAAGALSGTTVGVRLVGSLPARFDYGIEMAVQRGSLSTNSSEAWAGHWQLRQSLSGAGAVKLTGEYNYASGDADPADGVRGTFDHLHPTPHDKYGLADQIGWKNIRHARTGLEFSPHRGWPITTNYHSWWVNETRDAVYTAGGAPLARVPTGALHSHVGQEIDVQVTHALAPSLQIAGGYAHIFPGGFLQEATPGASYHYPYVMVTYAFLAEK